MNIFYRLVTLFQLSVDEFFYPAEKSVKSTRCRQIDNALDKLDEKGLIIVGATASGVARAEKEPEA